MKNSFTLGLFIIFLTSPLAFFAQTTIEIVADYDAALGYHDNFNTENNNYGTATQNAAYTIPGTNGGLNVNRSLIHFDLSVIPAGATIVNASLNLYALGPAGTLVGHSGMNNNGLLQRVIESWSPNVVSWSTQPATSEQNEVYMDPSTGALQDYIGIDVTAMTQDMMTDNNHGLLLKLANEATTNVLLFCSSNYADSAKHPKMVIQYLEPASIASSERWSESAEVFPNPSQGLVNCTITTPASHDNIRMEITTLQGTLAETLWMQPGRNQIDVSHLSAGMYLLRFRFQNHTMIKKITIQKP
jgi:hypothetical protein